MGGVVGGGRVDGVVGGGRVEGVVGGGRVEGVVGGLVDSVRPSGVIESKYNKLLVFE